ncbi:MAG TPA: hypothetical protein PLV30_07555 [Candidatus Marinimicrobia bacterium]|nr:hypothetical protein [Candidatus Neomarinimicrobiota bacterium]HQH56234.1 hypothetical protein [Candidatus Neomarinimicrobiota bacterium]HQK11861.1 hypothetical protein [Candidatus Neomarinimicrobiota bacterium]
MTEEQIRQIKLISYANWLVTEKFGAEKGIRDIKALTAAVTLPGNGTLSCVLGERLSNRKDLYAQLGWFVYYMIEGEPFNSKNRTTVLLILLWVLKYYRLEFNAEELANYIKTLDPLKHGNSDISLWFSTHCR